MRKDYSIHWVQEALQPVPEPDWVVEKLIAKPGVIMWFGDSGSKKSYSLFHQGLCVALGLQWLSFAVKQQTVLIIDEENGEYVMRARMAEILRGMGIDESYQQRIPLAWICDAHWNFMDSRDVDYLAQQIKKLKASFVIVDSFVDVLRGGDENSSKDTHKVLQGIRDVSRAANCVMSVIHHTNRKGGYRGSSNIKGELDVMIEVESDETSPNIDFTSQKNRHGTPLKFAAAAVWDQAVGEFTLNDSAEIGRLNQVDLYIMRCLTRKPMTLEQLTETMPDYFDLKKLRRSIQKLQELKRVQRANQTNPALYQLAPKSKAQKFASLC